MKFKATKKEMRDGYDKIIQATDIDQLLKFQDARAYSVRIEGWACDYYEVDGVLICTGYDPLKSKNAKTDYQTGREYNDKARAILDSDKPREQKEYEVNVLLSEYVAKMTYILTDEEIKQAKQIVKRIGGYRELIFLRTPCTIEKTNTWNSEHKVVEFIAKNTEPDGHADTISVDLVTGYIVG